MATLTALAFISLFVGAHSYCNVQVCVQEIDAILPNTSFICNNKAELETLFLKCMKDADGSPCDTEVRLAVLPKVDDVLQKYSQCPGAARQAKADSCNLGTLIGCLGYFATALRAPNFPLDDMDKFCEDLKKLVDRVEQCAICAGSMYLPDWPTIEKDVKYTADVVKSLLNGGCDCAKTLNLEVKKINTNETCAQVKAAKSAVQKVADQCIIPKINEITKFDMRALSGILVDAAISAAYQLCLLFGAAPQSAISSVTFVVGGATIALMFGLNRNTRFA